jgi:hypothetical protein
MFVLGHMAQNKHGSEADIDYSNERHVVIRH